MVVEPHHFTKEDFIRAFLGSFVVAANFLFSGMLLKIAETMNIYHMILLVVITCVLLTMEIHFLSYRYVNNKKQRPFLEFWGKRFISIMLSSYISIVFLMYLYGIDLMLVSPIDQFKVCIAVLMPAATAGGAMEILRKKNF